MNILVAALVLQPVKWHQKTPLDAETDSLYKPQPSVSGWVIENFTLKITSSRRLKCWKIFRTSTQTRATNSIETLSDDEDEYLETCPIYHDVDSQSIYGFDIIQNPLRKSDEVLWKDCRF